MIGLILDGMRTYPQAFKLGLNVGIGIAIIIAIIVFFRKK
jgi:hypothetical protein